MSVNISFNMCLVIFLCFNMSFQGVLRRGDVSRLLPIYLDRKKRWWSRVSSDNRHHFKQIVTNKLVLILYVSSFIFTEVAFSSLVYTHSQLVKNNKQQCSYLHCTQGIYRLFSACTAPKDLLQIPCTAAYYKIHHTYSMQRQHQC